MSRCAFCRKRNHLNMSCKWCAHDACVRCIQTEVHNCTGIPQMKETQVETLKQKLLSEKVVGEKLHSI